MRAQPLGDDVSDGEQLIARMNSIRNSSERHVLRMHAEAERLVDWREHVRAQPLLAMAVAGAAGFVLMYRKSARPQPAPARSAMDRTAMDRTGINRAAMNTGETMDTGQSDRATRSTFVSGAMAFAGTMIGNLLKQTASNYIKNQFSGVQHDRRESEQSKSSAEFAAQSPSRW